MKKHWREWFALANRVVWQAVAVPESRVEAFIASDNIASTEAMYQAFKARFLEETAEHATTKDLAHKEEK